MGYGVLFRGAAEGKIREKLIESGAIYAVIGLPSNLFYNTSIPTTIIALKKNRDGRDIFFIDASSQFEKGKNQNRMTKENIDHILDLYTKRENVDKESHLASYEEIKSNDYNLNIPRYVDTFEQEEDIDINDLANELSQISKDIHECDINLIDQMKKLTSADTDTQNSLNNLIRIMEEMS